MVQRERGRKDREDEEKQQTEQDVTTTGLGGVAGPADVIAGVGEDEIEQFHKAGRSGSTATGMWTLGGEEVEGGTMDQGGDMGLDGETMTGVRPTDVGLGADVGRSPEREETAGGLGSVTGAPAQAGRTPEGPGPMQPGTVADQGGEVDTEEITRRREESMTEGEEESGGDIGAV